MGNDFYESSSVARDTLDEAASLSEPDFLDLLFNGTEDELRDTRRAQVALVAVGVAIGRHLVQEGRTPQCCAGHSVGEIAALVVAGSLNFEDAVLLTHERARLMSEGMPAGTMAAVLGLDPASIEKALPDGTEVANYNGPQQTIISGSIEGIEKAKESLEAAGAKRVLPLNVSGPFHSSFMKDASQQFRSLLSDVAFEAPSCPVVSSVTGHQIRDYRTTPELLAQQLCSPVQWTRVMKLIGPVKAYEVGPGNVLQGLARRTQAAPQVMPAGTIEAVKLLDS